MDGKTFARLVAVIFVAGGGGGPPAPPNTAPPDEKTQPHPGPAPDPVGNNEPKARGERKTRRT
ncbi:hypothetical protein, partial [Mesorhizobium sp. M0006]|uniref:hypothetical protein n=1 Tax=Mesorhizobium sp. M0006 TaxID=2956838 RepID=UPI0033367B19